MNSVQATICGEKVPNGQVQARGDKVKAHSNYARPAPSPATRVGPTWKCDDPHQNHTPAEIELSVSVRLHWPLSNSIFQTWLSRLVDAMTTCAGTKGRGILEYPLASATAQTNDSQPWRCGPSAIAKRQGPTASAGGGRFPAGTGTSTRRARGGAWRAGSRRSRLKVPRDRNRCSCQRLLWNAKPHGRTDAD